jgi:hypothetical protein
MKNILVLLLTIVAINCDIFLHNLRGSNNRNCERNININNRDRLFNSQSDSSGGYACPRSVDNKVQEKIKLYVGSKLNIEWTTSKNLIDSNSNIILQYSCAKSMRDGTPMDQNDSATDSLTEQNREDPRQGTHEEFTYFKKCSTRSRNKGLFTSDVSIDSSYGTRQNKFAEKYGWECPEERDYYPYWHPTIWKDIAIFTNNVEHCDTYYRGQSQNTINKGECINNNNEGSQFNNEKECVENGQRWVMSGSHNIAPPLCTSLERVMNSNSYEWTVPNDMNENCVLRIRLNISSSEIPFSLDSNFNNERSPIKNQEIVNIQGYEHPIQLAVNSNQVGRVYQDRSYVFSIISRPNNIKKNQNIYNLNVIGKRGSYRQIYPSLQYRFSPRILKMKKNDLIHFQWTGSDYNPSRLPNDGEGGPSDPVGKIICVI